MVRGYIIPPQVDIEQFLRDKLKLHQFTLITPTNIKSFFLELVEEEIRRGEIKIISEIEAIYLLYNFLLENGYEKTLLGSILKDFTIYFASGNILLNEIETIVLNGYEKIKGIRVEFEPEEKGSITLSIVDRFYAYLKEKGLFTYGLILSYLNERGLKISSYEPIVFIDTVTLSRIEIEHLKKASKKTDIIFIFRGVEGVEFIKREFNMELEEINGGNNSQVEITLIRSPNIHGEVIALGKILQESLLKKNLIILPMVESFFPVMEFIVATIPSSFNIDYVYPLSRSSGFALLTLLFNAFSRRINNLFFYKDYIRVISHPYVKALLKNSLGLEPSYLIHSIIEFLTENELRYVELKRIEELDEIYKKAINKNKIKDETQNELIISLKKQLKFVHTYLFYNFESTSSVDKFLAQIYNLFKYISERGREIAHPFSLPFLNTILRETDKLRLTSIKELSLSNPAQYFKILKSYFSYLTVPLKYTTGDCNNYITTFFNYEPLIYDNIFILDLNEGIVPKEERRFLFLTEDIINYLELRRYLNSYINYRYQFYKLLRSGAKLFLFYQENDKVERSRLVEEFIWEREKREKKLNIIEPFEVNFKVSFSVASGIKKVDKDDVILDKILGLSFTSYQLDTYISCPLKFYYSYVLNIRAEKVIEEELDRSLIGNIVHEALELYFKEVVGKELTPELYDIKRLAYILNNLEDKYFKVKDLRVEITLAQIRRRLKETIEFYFGKVKAGDSIKVVEVEKEITKEVKINNISLRLSGRIDRIDIRKGKTILVEYKTGHYTRLPIRDPWVNISDPVERIKIFPSIQLPFYLLLYKMDKDIDINQLDITVLTIGSRELKEEFLLTDFEPREILWNFYATFIFKILEEIISPQVPFYMTPLTHQFCSYCSYSNICGTQYLR